MYLVEKKYDHIVFNAKRVGEETARDMIDKDLARNYSEDYKLYEECRKEYLEDLKNGRVELGDFILTKEED